MNHIAYMPIAHPPTWGLGALDDRAGEPVWGAVRMPNVADAQLALVPMGRWGLGDAGSALANQIAGAAMQGAGTAGKTGSAITGAVQAGVSATGALLGTTLITGTAICPLCAPILAIGAALVPIIAKVIEGCGNSCIQASEYANEVEPLLIQNLETYTSTPVGQRTVSMQNAALANFNTAYNQLVSSCQQVGGQGGKQCIADRQASGCKWKATAWKWNADGSFTPAGQAGSGSQCWNWVYGYHDPIANDPYVVPDSAVGGALSSLTSGSTAGVPNEFLLLGVLALLIGAIL